MCMNSVTRGCDKFVRGMRCYSSKRNLFCCLNVGKSMKNYFYTNKIYKLN